MDYINYVSKETKIVGLFGAKYFEQTRESWPMRNPCIREAMLAKGTAGYEIAVADGEDITKKGFTHEPRVGISLNVMYQRLQK